MNITRETYEYIVKYKADPEFVQSRLDKLTPEQLQKQKDNVYNICLKYFRDNACFCEDDRLFLPPLVAKELSMGLGFFFHGWFLGDK